MTKTPTDTTARIRELNDAFRQGTGEGQVFVTAGINDQGLEFVAAAMIGVREFSDFNRDNDPYGEHDFGALDVLGQKVFWKIDAYDKDLKYGSSDPTDPTVTTRVLTIMLASEY